MKGNDLGKKLIYKDEALNVVNICTLVMLVIIAFIAFLSTMGSSNVIVIIFVLFFILVIACIFAKSMIYDPLKNRFHYQQIKKKGTKIMATIEGFDYSYGFRSRDVDLKTVSNIVNHVKLKVVYINPFTNLRSEYVTPDVYFDPTLLGSKSCNVYLLDGEIYVSDFVPLERNNSKSIWDDNDPSIINLNNKLLELKSFKSFAFKAFPLIIVGFILIIVIIQLVFFGK